MSTTSASSELVERGDRARAIAASSTSLCVTKRTARIDRAAATPAVAEPLDEVVGAASSCRAHDVGAAPSRDRRCPATARPAQRVGERAGARVVVGQPSTIVSSATIPAAAISPAWRIPPPSGAGAARLGDHVGGPHSTAPTDRRAKPLRQAEHHGVGAAIELARRATERDRRVPDARAVDVHAEPRRRARACTSVRISSPPVGAPDAAMYVFSMHEQREVGGMWCADPSIVVRRSRRARPTSGCSCTPLFSGRAAPRTGTRGARSGHSTSVPRVQQHADRELVRHRARRHVERGLLAEQRRPRATAAG